MDTTDTKELRLPIAMIWHENTAGYIGKGNDLICRLKADMTHFKTMTTGHVVVYGRKTWESIPEKFRPLPGRLNVIISKTLTVHDVPEGVLMVPNIDPVELRLIIRHFIGNGNKVALVDDPTIYICGGEAVYNTFLPFAERLEITVSSGREVGDVRAPKYDPRNYAMTQSGDGYEENISFKFMTATLSTLVEKPPYAYPMGLVKWVDLMEHLMGDRESNFYADKLRRGQQQQDIDPKSDGNINRYLKKCLQVVSRDMSSAHTWPHRTPTNVIDEIYLLVLRWPSRGIPGVYALPHHDGDVCCVFMNPDLSFNKRHDVLFLKSDMAHLAEEASI